MTGNKLGDDGVNVLCDRLCSCPKICSIKLECESDHDFVFSWTHCLTLITLANQITLSDCSVVNKLFGGEYLTQINLSSESYHIDESVFSFIWKNNRKPTE